MMPHFAPGDWLLHVRTAPPRHEGGIGPDELILIIAAAIAVLGLLGLGYWVLRSRPWKEE